MAVRSWPPSRARTIRPPAKPISCFVRYPKPAAETGDARGAGGAGAWRPIKAAAVHRSRCSPGPRAGLVMEARPRGAELGRGPRLGVLFDLCESRNYGFEALIL